MTEGSSAWELKQEHWDELKASKGLCGSCAENWSGASFGSQDSDLTFGLYSFSMTEQKTEQQQNSISLVALIFIHFFRLAQPILSSPR